MTKHISLTGWLMALSVGLALVPAYAHGQTTADSLLAAAETQNLANEATWLKLGHFRTTLAGAKRSEVLTPAFFLADKGERDPRAELDATIRTMVQPVGDHPDQHAQCRFPARYQWLKRRLAFPATAPKADCKAFGSWMQGNAIDSISLIFVSGQLANPASYYGHVLLKFNSREGRASSGLLDATLNYGADFPAHEDPVRYIARGIFGGYHSAFTKVTFYNQSHKYAETDLRNLWEYELALDPWQRDLLLAHAWELMGQENRYFFLKQNCAYRMAELANLVVEAPLLPHGKAWAAPVDVFVRLMDAQQDGRPLVAQVHRLPSRQTQFREDLGALTSSSQDAVRRFIGEPSIPLDHLTAALPHETRAPVVEALIDYYTFAEIKSEDPAGEAARIKSRLLLARLALPAGPKVIPPTDAQPPHLGQHSSMLQASAVFNNQRGDGAELRFRGAHHDFLTYAPGVPANSELALVDVVVATSNGHTELRRAELAKVTNLNISETGLPGDGGRAWRVRVGAESRDLACTGCLAGYLEGGVGKGVALNPAVTFYGFIDGQVRLGDPDGGYAWIGPTTGVLFGPGRLWRAQLEAGVLQAIDGDQEARKTVSLHARFGASPHWDLRAGVTYQNYAGANAVEGRIGLATFW